MMRLVLLLAALSGAAQAAERPNVIFILADDLGYGDIGRHGATKVRTPNIDRLAKEGVTFTDAYAPHSLCTPTRYGLLTGRYAWRTWAQNGIVWDDDPLLIDPSRKTVATLFREAGYTTAVIGKWHLGYGSAESKLNEKAPGPDYNTRLSPGPLDVGFDYYYGFHANHYVENDRLIDRDPDVPINFGPDARWQANRITHFDRTGAPGLSLSGASPGKIDYSELSGRLTRKAVDYITGKKAQPFFLYLALRDPHTPLTAGKAFKDKSEIGPYGDAIAELDWSVGQVLDALDREGIAENTVVFFASDNGGFINFLPSMFGRVNGHAVNGGFFGQKTEVYEGGVRVPLLVRWPGVTAPATTSGALVALTDFFATVAEMLGAAVSADAGEDSFSFLGALNGRGNQPTRTSVVLDSMNGTYAIRSGTWKLITGSGGGGFSDSTDRFGAANQLYDLAADPSEQTNLIHAQPTIASNLRGLLRQIQYGGRSRNIK